MDRRRFEEWAPGEIARLRAEADALQRALDLYTGAGERTPNASFKKTGETSRAPRISKYESVMRAYEKEARPLSLDEMISIAHAHGFTIDRANMRSLVFVQKKLGRAIRQGDQYLWPGDKTEMAASDGEAAT